MIVIPPEQLAPQVLNALIEAYVLQEGTDYGEREIALARKIAELNTQIMKGRVLITWDEESESCNLVSREQFHAWGGRDE